MTSVSRNTACGLENGEYPFFPVEECAPAVFVCAAGLPVLNKAEFASKGAELRRQIWRHPEDSPAEAGNQVIDFILALDGLCSVR